MAHRTINGRPMEHLPALVDIARDDHPLVVIQKSAQVGASELLVNLALWACDSNFGGRGHTLMLFPTQNMMDDFTQGRIDRAIQDSTYLRQRLQPEPPRRKGADNKRLKRLGVGALYLRGSESRRQIASVDADLVILDEYDQMDEGVLDLSRKRLASSARPLLRIASTPRLPEAGINELYLQSDQRLYFFRCRACGVEQSLAWPESIDFERAIVVCRTCRAPLDVRSVGRWIAQAPGNTHIRGYKLSRLNSPWANIPQMIEASEATTPFAVQEFQNSDLGEPFCPPGGGVSIDVIDRCRQNYGMDEYAGQPCVMGVDVGLKQHVVIRQQQTYEERKASTPSRLWFADEVDEFGELDLLMARYNVRVAVVDAAPELHLARAFAERHRSRVWLAQYRQTLGHERTRGGASDVDRYHINRVEALDEVFDLFRTGQLALPRGARLLGGHVKEHLGDYYRQVLAPRRTIERDAHGNPVARWIDNGRADHYAHAELYCMMAGKIHGGRIGRIITF